jgi:acyl-CoA reductase-like NAD-dependent aldehyde dehydrogenase
MRVKAISPRDFPPVEEEEAASDRTSPTGPVAAGLRERVLRKGDYLWGSFVKPESVDAYINAINPGDRADPLGRFPFSKASVDHAVQSAQAGLKQWRRESLMERASAVRRFGDQLARVSDEAARMLLRETGRPTWETRQEVHAARRLVDLYLDDGVGLLAPRVIEEIGGRTDWVPRGVVAVIGAHPLPLQSLVQAVVASVLGGNAVIFKPSKFTPIVGQLVAECWDRARVPRGVVNLVQGSGAVVGQALAAHPGVDALLFSGAYDTAREIRRAVVDRPELPIAMATGGKGLAIVLGDADLQRAVYEVLVGACLSTGQRPTSTARVLVDAAVYDEFAEELVRRARKIQVGPGWAPDTFMGPMISEASRTKYRKYATALQSRGHQARMEPEAVEVSGYRGHYVGPAIYQVNWDNGLPFLNDEPPGPLLLLYRVHNAEEAIGVHNRANYRPATSVFTRRDNPVLAELKEQLRTGVLNVNRGTVAQSLRLPSAGQGRAGNGLAAGVELMRVVTYPRASLTATRPFDAGNVVPGVSWNDEETEEESDGPDLALE